MSASARSSSSRSSGTVFQSVVSKYQRPVSTSSVTSGRALRERSVSQSEVTSRSSARGFGMPVTSSSMSASGFCRRWREPLQLIEHGAAFGLGRVRGEDELDGKLVEDLLHRLRPARPVP